jgi:hypothetical protein
MDSQAHCGKRRGFEIPLSAAARVTIAWCTAQAVLGGCATTHPPPVDIDANNRVGVVLVGSKPAVNFPTASGNAGLLVSGSLLLGVIGAIPT